ncbi:hypothetical protein HIM_11841 [Hirsutella minnesotensis 3608]|uniref:Uncharacterized protein n=1 Tax=Hirsutella minnesotensis 3608 TaxID=1043627 RepID=A0A0F7ZWD3_9HYPO|nr:hypothetical protein HIM_11841 [Hirsutella minnesotensis 3608]
MLFIQFAALALAALVAAEPAEPEEHQYEARAPYLGILYSQPNYRGARQTISDRDSGRCINLHGSLREDVQSINIDRRERDSCTLRICSAKARLDAKSVFAVVVAAKVRLGSTLPTTATLPAAESAPSAAAAATKCLCILSSFGDGVATDAETR